MLVLALIVALADPPSFQDEVLPILANNCFACHGPDAGSREADLRLDTREGAMADRAIVPGSPDLSELIERVTSQNERRRMPKGSSGKCLTAGEVDILRRWIEAGAPYEGHWSFTPPKTVDPPPGDAWCRTPIDAFIKQRLDEAGLAPNADADKRTLIRRLALDLTGLPPTRAEVESFVGDEAPGAYERLVDRLLASPHFGEHAARPWLDIARYGDSQGYEADRLRTMWRYRDWVIDALNADMPFDQFTREQIAGDLMPEPTLAQRIATGFHRNTLTNSEGGTDDEEFRAAAVIDRVNTTMTAWMGLSAGCAQCHDHKFDPLTQKAYYELFAFFNQTADADREDDAPFIKAPTEAQVAALAALDARAATVEATPAAETATEARAAIERERQALDASVPTALVMQALEPDKQRTTHLFRGGSFRVPDTELGPLQPATPAFLHAMQHEGTATRLDLARWLTAPANPLTARVQVNRIWEQLFGSGIVSTVDNFGVQGSRPTHPQLLDWLAHHWQHELHWSPKALLRLLVLSSVYRQDARIEPIEIERDPDNRLLAHATRIRLSAEQLRDGALASAGLLRGDRIGGPSVVPHLPEGMLPQAFSDYVPTESTGDDLYRRGLYAQWRRTHLYPTFATFDATSRELCSVRRERSNTPLQALAMMNDDVFVEAAQALARRALEAGPDPIGSAFEFVLARRPSTAEHALLDRLHADALARAPLDPKLATEPLGPLPPGMDPNRAAAMTVVCNAILNLDECVTRP